MAWMAAGLTTSGIGYHWRTLTSSNSRTPPAGSIHLEQEKIDRQQCGEHDGLWHTDKIHVF
jgi:hypothetical protein